MSYYGSVSTDDELFRETHYARYGYERTNIYGLNVLQSRLPTYLGRQDEFPSHRFDKLPTDISPPPESQRPALAKPVRHLVAASASELITFVSRDGYWNSLTVSVGLETGKSEVIAMDTVEEQNETGEIRVLFALAIADKSGGTQAPVQFSLRLFTTDTTTNPFLEQALLSLNGKCQTIPLESAPMQITHVTVAHGGKRQTAFLLTSMDGYIHMYVWKESSFTEIPVATHFPMMERICELQARILFLYIYDRPNGKRVICAGGQNGSLFLGFYNEDGQETGYHAIRIFSPITSVLVFQPRVSQSVHADDVLHLVVTCAIEQAIVYKCIETNGLSKSRVLPESNLYDSVLCSHVMDVDWDGEHEIIIGTYGRQVLIYKQVAGTQEYNIMWRRQFAYPIYRIAHLDLNRDGLDELIVTTMYGVHILQPNMRKARERLLEVLQYVESNKRQILESLMEWRQQKEMEKAIVFEP